MVRVMVGGGHQSCQWGVVMVTCTRGLKRGCPIQNGKIDNKNKNKVAGFW